MGKVAFFAGLIVCVAFAPSSLAQKKIKYKDIWGLLNTKQYEAAEPFLKTYLKENNDNPNAFLFMGFIFQEKSGKEDVLKQTAKAMSHMDSAILFYNKAYQTITEKEIKKNDEYYQSYNRRDLRTGEFGVKLSDIQFDIEKRIEGLKERADRVKMVKHYFSLADTLYKACNSMFAKIQDGYQAEKEFYLRADQQTVAALTSLINKYDSSMKAFDQYKSSVLTLGKIGYSHAMVKKEIKVFKIDGLEPTDFYQNDLYVWDYKTWAQNARQSLEKEVFIIREHLVTYDIEINKLREKLNKDSVSVNNDLTKLIERLLTEQLKKYDAQPLPMDVFAVKIADLEYRSTLLENKKLKDSVDLHFRLTLAKKEFENAMKLDSVCTGALNRDVDKEALNYQNFVSSTFSNTTVLKSYLRAMKDFAAREKQLRESKLERLQNSLRWMVVNAVDSIPLFTEGTFARFQPLLVVNEKYTTGLQYADSLNATAYFYSITPSRIPDIKISFPVDKAVFRQSQSKDFRSLAYADNSGQVYYVLMYSEKPGKDNKIVTTIAKIYRSDGLAWSSTYALPFVPKELLFRNDTGEFVIRADAQESVVDKNGKMLR